MNRNNRIGQVSSMEMLVRSRWVLVCCIFAAVSGCGQPPVEPTNDSETQIVGAAENNIDQAIVVDLEAVAGSSADNLGTTYSETPADAVLEDELLAIRKQVSELDSALNANNEQGQNLKQRISSLQAQLAEMHRLANLEEVE
jgi:TolA-binding protein